MRVITNALETGSRVGWSIKKCIYALGRSSEAEIIARD